MKKLCSSDILAVGVLVIAGYSVYLAANFSEAIFGVALAGVFTALHAIVRHKYPAKEGQQGNDKDV